MVQTSRMSGVLSALSLFAPAVATTQTLVSPNAETNGCFGITLAAVPDVNGDGRGEMVVGAPNENYAGVQDAGRAYLYSGNGVRRSTLISPSPSQNGEFGGAVTGIPDVNGDGFGDVGVGARGENGGRVYIFSGATGARRLTINAPDAGWFGSAVVGLQDVTGDGRGDFAVGAPNVPPEGDLYVGSVGRVYVFNGWNGAPVRSFDSPNPGLWFGANFGGVLASVPDTNGDGRPEIAVGAAGELVGNEGSAGIVYIYSAATGALLRTLSSPHAQSNGHFGASVAGVPDANGDGRGDILIGAPDEIVGDNPDGAGRAYLFSGKTGALLRQFAAGAPEANDHFGSSVAGVTDLNGDGRGDVVIGAKGKTVPGSPAGAGRVFIYSGASGVFLRAYKSPNQEVNGSFGYSVAGLGDLNGDGRGDLGVGARNEDSPNRIDTGLAYLIRY